MANNSPIKIQIGAGRGSLRGDELTKRMSAAIYKEHYAGIHKELADRVTIDLQMILSKLADLLLSERNTKWTLDSFQGVLRNISTIFPDAPTGVGINKYKMHTLNWVKYTPQYFKDKYTRKVKEQVKYDKHKDKQDRGGYIIKPQNQQKGWFHADWQPDSQSLIQNLAKTDKFSKSFVGAKIKPTPTGVVLSVFPQLSLWSRNFEASLSGKLSEESIAKLRGRKSRYRPLLAPFFDIYTTGSVYKNLNQIRKGK